MGNAKDLAINEANYQNCDVNIVLATVEAETSFTNILGDSGNAMGYGQVWVAWWRAAFEYAGRRLNIPVPTDLASVQQLTLGNDQFSMIVAINVIKSVWLSSGKNWDKFTHSYVGSAIPDSDYNRRLRIWEKYEGGSYQNNSTGFGSNMTALGGNQEEIITSDYGIVPNSVQDKNVLYGRRYRVMVTNKTGKGLDVSDLRCTFKCVKTVQMQPNISEVVIYNLNAQTENLFIDEGNRVVIEAGYEGEQYGVIFDGTITQPIREKENGTDYKLTLIAMDGDAFFGGGMINTTYVKGKTKRAIIENIVTQAKNPLTFGNISANLSTTELTRGKVVFGLARDYLRQLAQSENATWYIEDGKVNIVKVSDVPEGEVIELSAESGMIGTPTQTEQGVTIKCLLNPQIKTNRLIHIDNSVVREMMIPIIPIPTSATSAPAAPNTRNLNNDGLYRVIKVSYIGDTRGDDWYCECECINQAGLLPTLAINELSKVFN